MTAVILLLAATFTRPLERVSSLDPALATTLYDFHAVGLVYEAPLAVDYRKRPYELTAGYCERPTVSADGLVYVFRTRGGPAADMVASLERLRDPSIVSPNGWIVRDIDTIRAIDARTVEIRLKRRVSYFPWLMAMGAASVRRADGSGTGPYELTHWRKNHEMIFTRRAGAVDETGGKGFDTIRYLVIDDVSTQWLMFLKGEIDFLGEVSRDNWDSVIGADGKLDPALAAKGIGLCQYPTLDAMYIGINCADPVLGPNRKLRQALNAAFDFPAWSAFYNNSVQEAGGPVPVGVDGHLDAKTFPYRFDLELAKRLLREAGYPGGIDPKTGRRLVLSLAIGRASQGSREAGELIASFYERIGIKLELKFYTWDAFLSAVNEGRVQLYRMGWVGDYPHAQNFLQLFHSANRSPGVNHSNYSNPEFDAAYAQEDWARCQEIVREDCPWVFTHFNVSSTLTGPRVGNYVPSVFSGGNERYYQVRE